MDQLCINQDDEKEKAKEINKMRQYYDSAETTLIAINNEARSETINKENNKELILEILKKIVISE